MTWVAPQARTHCAGALGPLENALANANAGPCERVDATEAVNNLMVGLRLHNPCSGKQARQELDEGWRALLNLDLEAAFAIGTAVENRLADISSTLMRRIFCEIQLLRAVAFAFSDNYAAAHTFALKVLQNRLPPRLSRVASTVCRLGHWKAGELEKLDKVEASPPRIRKLNTCSSIDAFDLSIQAAAAFQQLDLSTAEMRAKAALSLARDQSGTASAAAHSSAAIVAQVAYQRNDFVQAESVLHGLFYRPLKRLPIECLARGYPLYAQIIGRRFDRLKAMQYLRDGEELGRERGSPRLIAYCLSAQIDFCIDDAEIDQACECLARLHSVAYIHQRASCGRQSVIAIQCALADARLRLVTSSCRAQISVLRQLHQSAVDWNDYYGAVIIAIRLIEALHIIGDIEEACRILARVLRISMNSGTFRTLIDGGSHVREMLVLMQTRLTPDSEDLLPFLNGIIRHLPEPGRRPHVPRVRASSRGALSPRESNILLLIGRGFSNKGIAKKLQITPETVKSHAKRIFVKLNAQTRAEAVARAAELRLRLRGSVASDADTRKNTRSDDGLGALDDEIRFKGNGSIL